MFDEIVRKQILRDRVDKAVSSYNELCAVFDDLIMQFRKTLENSPFGKAVEWRDGVLRLMGQDVELVFKPFMDENMQVYGEILMQRSGIILCSFRFNKIGVFEITGRQFNIHKTDGFLQMMYEVIGLFLESDVLKQSSVAKKGDKDA